MVLCFMQAAYMSRCLVICFQILGEGYITNAKKINRDKSNSVTGTSFNTQTQLLHKFASVSCAPFLYYTLTLTLIAYS